MARVLIVGCGCRGRLLAAELAQRGWHVRGTSRRAEGISEIERAGIEAAEADPDRVGTILDHVVDVTVLVHLLGSAQGAPGQVEAAHGPRLERLLEKLVDTPVRGFVYEAAGSVDASVLEGGSELVSDAARRWRIRTSLIEADPRDRKSWTDAGLAAVSAAQGGV